MNKIISTYIIICVNLILFSSCNGQNKIEPTTHLSNYYLKGKVKLLKEKLCSALVSLDGTVEILDECVPPKDLGKPYQMEFNEQGYLTLHKYYAGSNFWRDYYEYKNDTILISKKITSEQYLKSKPVWAIQHYFKYDKYGRVSFVGFNYLLADKCPSDEIFFEYDDKGNVNSLNSKTYYYKVDEEIKGIDSIVPSSFNVKNIYINDLLKSYQFTNSDGGVLTFDRQGEISDIHEGEFIQDMDWNGNLVTIGDKTIYTYNKQGHKTEITTVSAYGDSSTNSFTYYLNGGLKSCVYRNIEGRVVSTEKFNEEGYRTYHRSVYNQTYDYTYKDRDEQGNWTTCQVNKNGRIYYFITREIEYYQD